MGLMCFVSRTVLSSDLGRAAIILVFVILLAGRSHAEVLRGVLYSIHHGQGRDPGGQVELAVGKKISKLDYVPRAVSFKNRICYEIGSIWIATVARSNGGGQYITDVTCTGQVDKNVHKPWLIVRQYLDWLAGKRPGRDSESFSSRWQSSVDCDRYQQQAQKFRLGSYLMFGESGSCLNVVDVEPAVRTRISAGLCFIDLQQPGDLLFDVIWNSRTQKWEIDEIKIQTPEWQKTK